MPRKPKPPHIPDAREPSGRIALRQPFSAPSDVTIKPKPKKGKRGIYNRRDLRAKD